MSDDRQCANSECSKPLVQKDGETQKAFRRRRSCNPHCGSKAGHQKHLAIYGEHKGVGGVPRQTGETTGYEPHWPAITGEFIGSFEGMDVETSDNYLARLDRPVNANQSGSGNAGFRCTE